MGKVIDLEGADLEPTPRRGKVIDLEAADLAAGSPEGEASAAGNAIQQAAASGAPPPPNILQRAWQATKAGGRALMGVPGEISADPGNAPRSLTTGAAQGATLGATKDLHGPALSRMRAKATAGSLTPEDLRTLSMWQDMADPGRERTPITDPLATIDALEGIHSETQQRTAAQPGLQFTGALLAPTPGKTVGGAVMRAGGAATAGARVLQSALAGAAGGATDAAGSTAVAGGGAGDVALAGLEGGAFGAGAGALGGATVEGGRKVLQSAFPAVGDFAAAREAGLIPKAESQAHGRAGVKEAAFEAADTIEAKKEALLKAVGELHAEAMAKAGAKPVEMQPLLEHLAALDASARFPEGDVLPGKEGVSRMAGETFDTVTNAPRTVEGMVKLRRAAAEAAAFESQSPSDAQLARRDVYGAIRSSVRESAPEVGAADDAFAAAKQGAARTNENLYGTPKDPRIAADAENAPAPISPKDRIKAMTRLARYGSHETAEPSTSIQPYLEDLAKQDPEFAKALDAIVAKKALEDTRFGLGHGGGTQVDLQGAVHGGVKKFLGQNATALARRADDIALRGAGQRSTAASNWQQFLIAKQREDERERERARRMRGEP